MSFGKIVSLAAILLAWTGGFAQAMGNDPDQSVVRIMSATYGASCGVAAGNATRHVAGHCNGRKSCNYKVSYQVLGDPAYGCKKDFFVSYYCGRNGPFQRKAAGEAGYGTVVQITCDAPGGGRGITNPGRPGGTSTSGLPKLSPACGKLLRQYLTAPGAKAFAASESGRQCGYGANRDRGNVSSTVALGICHSHGGVNCRVIYSSDR